jgi:3-phenylpropionate/trans-cinnamate dioxygenase ferredoxin subunit
VAEFVSVGKKNDFKDGVLRAFDVDGESVAVVNWRERWFAFANLCTHLDANLSAGYITGADEIVCMLHDSVFEMATGKAVDGPAPEDIPVYAVRVEGEDVLVSKEPVVAERG